VVDVRDHRDRPLMQLLHEAQRICFCYPFGCKSTIEKLN
jgi:hypothetical protein